MPSIGWDRREYDHERYKYAKNLLITWLGGKCVHCGETNRDILEFDHLEQTTKLWNIASMWNRPRELEIELKKVRLLCYSCHKARTKVQMSVEHGGGKSGRKGCKCELCLAKKAEWQREYRRKKKAEAAEQAPQ
ncbi:MAG: hypothetical protein EON57_17670 [Alphaproteobacteria bacterium]|nr:MAG: hypothetical protein EON57_17670 [Alphaproteobacteria bacterium]